MAERIPRPTLMTFAEAAQLNPNKPVFRDVLPGFQCRVSEFF